MSTRQSIADLYATYEDVFGYKPKSMDKFFKFVAGSGYKFREVKQFWQSSSSDANICMHKHDVISRSGNTVVHPRPHADDSRVREREHYEDAHLSSVERMALRYGALAEKKCVKQKRRKITPRASKKTLLKKIEVSDRELEHKQNVTVCSEIDRVRNALKKIMIQSRNERQVIDAFGHSWDEKQIDNMVNDLDDESPSHDATRDGDGDDGYIAPAQAEMIAVAEKGKIKQYIDRRIFAGFVKIAKQSNEFLKAKYLMFMLIGQAVEIKSVENNAGNNYWDVGDVGRELVKAHIHKRDWKK
mmetsp:Transcript_50673/g.84270  ORF Transcript_50673/g.84270 Transcript_50673/m.84270 type:complete len:300 (-) Transcript_50673:39-938(-)